MTSETKEQPLLAKVSAHLLVSRWLGFTSYLWKAWTWIKFFQSCTMLQIRMLGQETLLKANTISIASSFTIK